jgi:hypothetical protein
MKALLITSAKKSFTSLKYTSCDLSLQERVESEKQKVKSEDKKQNKNDANKIY